MLLFILSNVYYSCYCHALTRNMQDTRNVRSRTPACIILVWFIRTCVIQYPGLTCHSFELKKLKTGRFSSSPFKELVLVYKNTWFSASRVDSPHVRIERTWKLVDLIVSHLKNGDWSIQGYWRFFRMLTLYINIRATAKDKWLPWSVRVEWGEGVICGLLEKWVCFLSNEWH